MHGIGVAEEVVQIAEDFLIGAGQEDAEDVVFAVAELVQLQTGTTLLVADEAIDLAIGIARDVLQRATTHRLLKQAMDRHDREELVDGPAVRQ